MIWFIYNWGRYDTTIFTFSFSVFSSRLFSIITMPSSGIKKIIHCVCPLSTDGIPIPFSTHTSDANLPPSPPTTPNHFSDKTQAVPLNIYYPSKELFNVRSRPSWYMIHAAASLSLAGYDQSICIDSRPSKHASVDRDLYAFVVNGN